MARSNGIMDRYFGVEDDSVQKSILNSLTQLGEADLEELEVFAEDYGVDRDTLRRTLEWAELLHLVRRVGRGVWRIDAVVGRLLSS